MEHNKSSVLNIILLGILGLLVVVLVVLIFFTWTYTKEEPVVEENVVQNQALPEVTETELKQDARSRGQFHFVPENAVASVLLDVTDCEASPDVLSVPLGEELVILNNGDEDVTLMINAKDYVIPAQGQLATTTEFGKGAMAYGYSCSLKNRMVGVIVVTQ